MADATRDEVIQWCADNKVDFNKPKFPPPEGWMWADTGVPAKVLTTIFTNTEDEDIVSIDNVNHPSHYGGVNNPHEAIKVIDAWNLGFCLGNTLKYIARAGKKNNDLEDLKKARWYLNHEIEKLETGNG